MTAFDTFKELVIDHPNHQDDMQDLENIALTVEYMLGDAKKNAPFYWQVWQPQEDGRVIRKVSTIILTPVSHTNGYFKGRLQGALIIGTLAYHRSIIFELPEREHSKERPHGALALSIIAVLSTLL